MPFWYHVPVPIIDNPQPTTVRLVKWLVGPGTEVHRGTKIAVIESPTGRYAVMTNGEGFLREQHFPAGAEIESSIPIGTIAADGENIPYERPLSLSERLVE